MNRVAFTNYLNNYLRPNGAHLTAPALSKADEAETVLGHSLDIAVATDPQMRTDLCTLRRNNAHEIRYGQMQNVLSKYYHMVHNHWFPRLRDV